MKSEDVVHIFMENAAKASSKLSRVANIDNLNETLEKVLDGEKAIYCQGTTELEKLVKIDPDRRVDSCWNATTTVEEVVCGIAETGSVVVTSACGRAVQASLLPTHHVAIVRAENIFPTIDDFFAGIGENPPTNITLITGPSRTGDIELTLTIGVHGPEKVSILVI